MEAFKRRVYEGMERGTLDYRLWKAVLDVISGGVVEGLSDTDIPPTHEQEFLRELRHSTQVFAAFKVHTMAENMRSRLLRPDGTLKPFREWAEEVAPIASHHVGAWLRTEYDTAVIRAHNAADWRGFERDKDIMPNLRWMPTTSPEPDGKHRVYWQRKLTLPVGHPFWEEHHPGDRWNCKCSLEQTDDPANPEVLDNMGDIPAQRGLENNPGRDGHVFSDKHPYFPKSCSTCNFYKPNLKNRLTTLFQNRRKDCYNCPYINGCLDVVKNGGFILKSEYKNGGKLYIHPNADKDKVDYHPIINIGKHFAKQGEVVRITPRVHIKSPEYRWIYGKLIGTKYEGKCPDLQVGEKFYEFEGFVKPWSKKKVGRMLSHGLQQSSYLIVDNTKGCSDRFIRKMLKARLNTHPNAIKELWIYEKGCVRLFYKDGKFV